jgi:hypothetical protein
MFRVLEDKLATGLVFYGCFALKNHFGSSQKRVFYKSSILALASYVRFLSFQAFFQTIALKHFEQREVKHDPSLSFVASLCNELGTLHGYVDR